MKKIVSIIVILISISGCGGSSNSRSNIGNDNTTPVAPPPSNNPTEVVAMVLDEPYQVDKYDEINKTSNEAKIEVIHFEDGGTAAILRAGSATLSRY